MATITLDPESLSRLLCSVGPPAFAAAECTITPPHLVVTLRHVQSGMRFLGKAVGHFDISILVKAELTHAGQVRVDWELDQVSGLPTALARMIAKGSLVRGKLEELITRLGLATAVTLDSGNTGALLKLDQLPWLQHGLLRQLTCQRFDIPGGKSHALSAHLTFEEADAPPHEGRHAARHRH